jgi:hypothetical protein
MRPPNDPSSIADEPKDPPAEDPVFAPITNSSDEPEITLESVTIKPLSKSAHAKELGETKIIVTLGQLQLLSSASDSENVKAWIRNLAYWIAEQSSCSKDSGVRSLKRAKHCQLADKRVKIVSDQLAAFKALEAIDEDSRTRPRGESSPDVAGARPAENGTGSLNKVD